MTDKKYTDEEIVKALECCINRSCNGNCPYYLTDALDAECRKMAAENALFLINRQKTEIEKLQKAKYIYATVDYCADDLATALEENKALKAQNDVLTKNLEAMAMTMPNMAKAETANKRAEEAEKKFSELASSAVDKEAIRQEYAGEIEKLKERLRNAENSRVQKFAVHFDLLQTELQICDSLILEEIEKDISLKLRKAFLTVLEPYTHA